MQTAIDRIPSRMIPGLVRYLAYGTVPGDFLSSVLQNNLMEAALRADDENARHLFDYGGVLYAHVPSCSKGSWDAVKSWSDLGGYHGDLKNASTPPGSWARCTWNSLTRNGTADCSDFVKAILIEECNAPADFLAR